MRELSEESGIQHTHISDRVCAGPDVIALNDSTYFAYALSRPFSQAELRQHFAQREETGTIIKIAWKDIREAGELTWRTEDRVMLQRLIEDERHEAPRRMADREKGVGDVEQWPRAGPGHHPPSPAGLCRVNR